MNTPDATVGTLFHAEAATALAHMIWPEIGRRYAAGLVGLGQSAFAMTCAKAVG